MKKSKGLEMHFFLHFEKHVYIQNILKSGTVECNTHKKKTKKLKTSCSSFSFRAVRRISHLKPALHSPLTIASPMPLFAPVTTATFLDIVGLYIVCLPLSKGIKSRN